MKNVAGIDEAVLEGFEEFLAMGLNSSAEVFSKLLNNEVTVGAEEIVSEKIEGLASFGEDDGIAVSLNIGGAVIGRAALVIRQDSAKDILDVLMSGADEEEGSSEIDDVSLGTIKELVGQMSAAFAEAATNFFGSAVSIEAQDICILSPDHNELGGIFECANDTNIYSVVSSFSIEGHGEGSFNIEINRDTLDFTLNRLNMIPGTDAQSMYMNAVTGNNAPVNMQPMGKIRGGRPGTVMKDSINIQTAQFPNFSNQMNGAGLSLMNGNMDLLMDVPLNVTIEIGKTRKKMRDIMEFAQGTVIDLEKQAGAPVDIVVNGQLIARGDVVVIDDNFGVRITEIIGNSTFLTKE